MNEEKTLFKIDKLEDGVSVDVHCDGLDELVNVTRSIASVAKADEAFCFFLLASLKHYFTEEGERELEKHSVEMPDFNKLLKNDN